MYLKIYLSGKNKNLDKRQNFIYASIKIILDIYKENFLIRLKIDTYAPKKYFSFKKEKI